jgi:hypothetical protein
MIAILIFDEFLYKGVSDGQKAKKEHARALIEWTGAF